MDAALRELVPRSTAGDSSEALRALHDVSQPRPVTSVVGNHTKEPQMLRTTLSSVLLVLASAALLTGCGRKASDEIDFGTLKNSVYQNNYFGLTVTIPTDWSVQDQASQQQIMVAGKALVAGDDKNLKAVLKATELQSVNLFTVFKYPLGSPVTFNPAIVAVAETVRQLPGIQRGKDYLFHARQLLQSSQVRASFPKEIYTVRLGGVDFDVMDSEFSIRGITVKEKYYATIRKGYALAFVVSYEKDEEESFQRKVLETITFK
jgi:hypothetical protein